MYGITLLYLARLVGLRQVDIAAHLGITKVQVHYWARGIRPIPAATLPTLVKRIAEAVDRYLATGETDMQIAVPGQTDARRQPTRADLAAVLNTCFAENFMRHGHREYQPLKALLRQLEAYSEIPPKEHLDAGALARLTQLTAALYLTTTLLSALLPLLLLLPDKDTPFIVEPTEGFYADTH